MPNWCATSYAFYPRTESPEATAQLRDFYQKISGPKNGLYELGETVFCIPKDDLDKMYLRGWIQDNWLSSDEIGEYIRVDSEDAWAPVKDLYDYLLRTKYDLLTYCYIAEEPGCGVYINTDTSKNHRFFEDRFVIDLYPPKESGLISDHYYCRTAKEVVEYISDVYHRRFKSLKDIYRFIDTGYAEGLWIYKFENA